MKKITLLISVCIASAFTLFAQDQLMVHQNNGNTTPFIASSVDSITIVSANNNVENKNEHQYVDMGLSVMWATCNIGANSPEEFGDYFAWGEKETKDEYTPENWKGTSSTTWEISNDPARNAWGGDWRVPTFWEFIELINNCKTQTCVKTSKDGYGILGTLFISKINGNKIFLPMAGHSTLGETYTDTMPFTSTGATGYYRASQYGLGIMLFPWNGIDFTENNFPFYVGESVRPVFGESTQTGNFEDYNIDEDLYAPEVLWIDGGGSNIELEVGESTQLFATSSSNVSWEILSGEGIVEIEYIDYPKNKSVRINALSDGTAVVQATDGRTKAVVEINVIPQETLPKVMAPGSGFVTIAIYVPEETCNGVILVGAGLGEGGTDDWDPGAKNNPFTKLDGEERWYTITVPYYADLAVKAVAINSEGKANWSTQWGMNVEGEDDNVVILSGEGLLDNSENYGEIKLTQVLDGSVIYIGIKEWKSIPCEPRNKAGKATFTLTAVTPLPEGAVVGIVGSISEVLNWDIYNPVVMTQNGNTYTATVTVGDACEYKYFVSLDGGATWDWSIGEYGNNRQMPLDLNAVDTVEEWVGIFAEEFPEE